MARITSGLCALLQARGIPVDGVGLQFHISVQSPPPLPEIAANMVGNTARPSSMAHR